MSTSAIKGTAAAPREPTPKRGFWPQQSPNRRQEILRREVRKAVGKLDFYQREFIEYFYFMGESYEQIERRLNKERYRLEWIHHLALERLRFLLADFVEAHFGLKVEKTSLCPICNHPRKQDIERVLKRKRPEETWRPILQILRRRFDLKITTVQVVIAHVRKHM